MQNQDSKQMRERAQSSSTTKGGEEQNLSAQRSEEVDGAKRGNFARSEVRKNEFKEDGAFERDLQGDSYKGEESVDEKPDERDKDNIWKKVETWADLDLEADLANDEEKANSAAEVAVKKSNFPNWTDILAIIGILFLALTLSGPLARLLGFEFPASMSDFDSVVNSSERRALEYEIGRSHFWIALISQSLIYLFLIIYRAARGGEWGVVRFSANGLNPTILLWGLIMLLSTSITISPLMELLPENKPLLGRGIYMIAAVALVAPIFEELIFRGMILEAVKRRFGAWSACIVSSFIFGLIHIQVQSMANAMIIGLILGFLYLRTKSIFAPMIIHAANNILAYLLLILGLENISLHEIVANETIYRVIYFASVGILLLSIIIIIMQISKQNKREKEKISYSRT